MEGHEMDLVQNVADQEMLDQPDAAADDTEVNSTLTPQLEQQQPKPKVKNVTEVNNNNNNNAGEMAVYDEAGTPMEQEEFMKELEHFYRSRLWRAVIRLGGYEVALLEYEKHKREIGELQLPVGSIHQPSSVEKESSIAMTTFKDACGRGPIGHTRYVPMP